MKPAPFTYYAPQTLEEALLLLTEHGLDGKVIAGGQSLVPIMNMRLSAPTYLIDINRIKNLNYIHYQDGELMIGSLTRQRCVESSMVVQEHCPLLAECVPYIGHVQTRNRGTVGGSLVHADPTAELPLVMLVLGAKVLIQSAEEKRKVDVEDFFITYLTTDLQPDEIVTEIQVDLRNLPTGFSFQEYSRRHGDFALVTAAALLDVDETGVISGGSLGLGGVDAVPVLARDAIEFLIGKRLTDEVLAKAVTLAIADVDPESDLHASREYRIHLVEIYVKKALREAYARAAEASATEGLV